MHSERTPVQCRPPSQFQTVDDFFDEQMLAAHTSPPTPRKTISPPNSAAQILRAAGADNRLGFLYQYLEPLNSFQSRRERWYVSRCRSLVARQMRSALPRNHDAYRPRKIEAALSGSLLGHV